MNDLPNVEGTLTGPERQRAIDEHIAWLVGRQAMEAAQDYPLARWAARNARLVARTKAIGRQRPRPSRSKAA